MANSLYAIKKIVFEEKRISLETLLQAVKDDWKDAEALRVYLKNKLIYYGNDSADGADDIMACLLNDFAKITVLFAARHRSALMREKFLRRTRLQHQERIFPEQRQ